MAVAAPRAILALGPPVLRLALMSRLPMVVRLFSCDSHRLRLVGFPLGHDAPRVPERCGSGGLGAGRGGIGRPRRPGAVHLVGGRRPGKRSAPRAVALSAAATYAPGPPTDPTRSD